MRKTVLMSVFAVVILVFCIQRIMISQKRVQHNRLIQRLESELKTKHSQNPIPQPSLVEEYSPAELLEEKAFKEQKTTQKKSTPAA